MTIKRLNILILSIILLSGNSYADGLSAGYESMLINQSYKLHVCDEGWSRHKLTSKARLDIANIAYLMDIGNAQLTAGFKFDVTQNHGTYKIDHLEHAPSEVLKDLDADYKELYLELLAPFNNYLNFALQTNFNQFSTKKKHDYDAKNRFKAIGLQATAELHDSIGGFSYSLKAGPVLEKGFHRYDERDNETVVKFDYLNFGFNINPSISYHFTDNLSIKAQYNRTQTKDLSISKEYWSGCESCGESYVSRNRKLTEAVGVNLLYTF